MSNSTQPQAGEERFVSSAIIKCFSCCFQARLHGQLQLYEAEHLCQVCAERHPRRSGLGSKQTTLASQVSVAQAEVGNSFTPRADLRPLQSL